MLKLAVQSNMFYEKKHDFLLLNKDLSKHAMSTDLESIPTKFVTCNEIWRTLVYINSLLIYVDVLG